MDILINEKNQAQCPKCGQWVNMIYNDKNKKFEISHCRETWILYYKVK